MELIKFFFYAILCLVRCAQVQPSGVLWAPWMISLNKHSAIPIYRQLADVLHSQFLKSELKPGDQLPLEFDLVERYAVSRSSVRHAIDLLVQEGAAGYGGPAPG